MSDKDELKKQHNQTEDQLSELDSGIIDNATQEDIKKILDVLNINDSFDEELEQILGNFNELTNDLSKLQTQILLLVKKYREKIKTSDISKANNVNIHDKSIIDNLALAHSAIIQKENTKDNKSNLAIKLQSRSNMSKQAQDDIKRAVKNFAVYELYKFLNPRRIAGETKVENFVHNMIIGGLGRATKYTGGKKHDLEHYSKEFIQKLEAKHKSFRRNPTIRR